MTRAPRVLWKVSGVLALCAAGLTGVLMWGRGSDLPPEAWSDKSSTPSVTSRRFIRTEPGPREGVAPSATPSALRTPYEGSMPVYLAQLESLDSKALRTKEEDQEITVLVQSDELIDQSLSLIMAETVSAYSEGEERQRMYAISHVTRAALTADVAKRAELVKRIRLAILADSGHPDGKRDVALRKSLAGDKVELFRALRSVDRASSDSLLKEVKGRRLEGLLNFAEQEARSTEAFRAKSRRAG